MCLFNKDYLQFWVLVMAADMARMLMNEKKGAPRMKCVPRSVKVECIWACVAFEFSQH